MIRKVNLDAMSVDEMWQLHEEISRVLSVRLTSEKRELEKRLEQLRRDKQAHSLKSSSGIKDLARAPRRKYPRVYPKYQNPQVPSETWSGRGKTPRWLVAALKTGQKLEHFAIGSPFGAPARKQKK
jgi:DNA-binding protein H-NS